MYSVRTESVNDFHTFCLGKQWEVWHIYFLTCIIYLFVSECTNYVGYTANDGMMNEDSGCGLFQRQYFCICLRRLKKDVINITPLGWLLKEGPPEYKAGFQITLSQNIAPNYKYQKQESTSQECVQYTTTHS
jgi:hypothetical protein